MPMLYRRSSGRKNRIAAKSTPRTASKGEGALKMNVAARIGAATVRASFAVMTRSIGQSVGRPAWASIRSRRVRETFGTRVLDRVETFLALPEDVAGRGATAVVTLGPRRRFSMARTFVALGPAAMVNVK